MKECSWSACCSRRFEPGIGEGPRNGDSDTSEVDPRDDDWPAKRRRRESLVAMGDMGVVDDDAPEKSSERAAASRYESVDFESC